MGYVPVPYYHASKCEVWTDSLARTKSQPAKLYGEVFTTKKYEKIINEKAWPRADVGAAGV